MEKLQVAIEQARQRREGKGGGQTPPRTPKSAPSTSPARKRVSPRVLPDGLMELWGELPEIKLPKSIGDGRRLVAHLPGGESSHYDILRTKVLIELRKNGWRRVAITSPTGSCGKTTTASNLALGIARQGELRTALFDLDLRRPGIGRVFGTQPDRDISEFLTGAIGFGQQAMRVGSNLAVAIAKHSQADPTKLIAGKKAFEAIDAVEREFAPDVMIFDLPPLLVSDDARAFLRNVDCAILMARAESSTAAQIDMCEREIAEQTNVLGVVLNECRFDEGGQYGQDYNY
ncbi:MAG: CpsD/CapB family tyrosine-protein kinase [Paracoccaceae bacterium]|nr:CpsD/CapB family tyrosine-protein kinase [Paracoccaceae bacterium]